MKTSLSRSKRKKGSMKTTHTLDQVEALMWKESGILRDPNVGKDAKQKAMKRLKLLEKHFADCKEKETNGHKYPERMKGFPDDVPMNKEEVLKLIDSVESDYGPSYADIGDVNLQGLMISATDQGWDKPKVMKPVPLFK